MNIHLRFPVETTRQLAASILSKNEVPFEFGMLNSLVVPQDALSWALSELSVAQIWPHKSFHGGPDFSIEA